MINSVWHLCWKIPVISGIYFASSMVSGSLVTNLGLQFPDMPGHVYVPLLNYLNALVLVACIAWLAKDLAGRSVKRWLILTAFVYISYVVNNQIEAWVFTYPHEVPTMLVFFILPCVAAMAAVAVLVRPVRQEPLLATVFSDRSPKTWWWRMVLAWISFPVIYYVCGALIYPIVSDAYEQTGSGLHVPGQATVLGAVAVRSLLFLVATIPILSNWSGSRRGLILSLAAALAAMVGVAGMIENTWMPDKLRVVHSLEIIAGSLAHAWVLVALLVSREQGPATAIASPDPE